MSTLSSQDRAAAPPPWTLEDRLRKARERTGMEKQAFAEALGVTRNTVGNYELGKTTQQRTILRAWASLCDVPFGWLIGDESGKPAGNRYLELDELRLCDLQAA